VKKADKRVLENISERYFRDVSGAMDRCQRIADEAATAHIECKGERISETGHYVFCPDEVASDEMLADCIEHLCWRGRATRIEKSDEVEVIMHD